MLVSKAKVEADWSPLKRSWFYENAYPISDDVYAIWSDEPNDWRPINHSCDPCAWLLGMDMHARRDIAADEPITLDYATFCNEIMAPFDCWCGAAACRKRVTGEDYRNPDLVRMYSGHCSPYVTRFHKSTFGSR